MAAETRPRLLYLLTSLNAGGAEWGLVTLVREGAFEGVELTVAALVRGAGAQVAALRALGVEPRILLDARRPTPTALIRAGLRLRRLLRRELRPDALVLSLPHANLLGRLLRPGRPRPLVLSFEHNNRLARRAYEIGYRLTSGRVDWMLADCEATADAAARRLYRCMPERRTVLPLASFPPGRFAPGPERPAGGPLRLLSAGRLTAAKNHAHLVDVVAALRRRGEAATLTVFGEGPRRAALERRAAGLGGAVSFPGHRAEWWRTPADVFVLASRHEGLCISALEALAAGLPLAAPPVGGLAEYGPAAGMLPLDGRDPEADADRLQALLHDPPRREAMARAGREVAAARCSRSAVQARCRLFRIALDRALGGKGEDEAHEIA